MKVALIAAPFISVPPADYGGTELFVAHLAEGLSREGVQVIVYANGESTIKTELRSIYPRSEWPIKIAENAWLRELNHESWAVHDAARDCDIIHVQSAPAVTVSRFAKQPVVLTLHGPHEPALSELYTFYPDVHYVCISDAQCKQETMPKVRTIHHGIDVSRYRLVEKKQQLSELYRAHCADQGTHLAIDVARRTGLPLKIAGEVQPVNREYFEGKLNLRSTAASSSISVQPISKPRTSSWETP